MNSLVIAEEMAYIVGTLLVIAFIVLIIVTGSMFARQKNTTSKPNEYLSDKLVFYSVGYTKGFKLMAMITFSGFFVLLPAAIAYGISCVYLEDRAWIPAVIALGIGIVIMIVIGMKPSAYREECLIVDAQKVTVK